MRHWVNGRILCRARYLWVRSFWLFYDDATTVMKGQSYVLCDFDLWKWRLFKWHSLLSCLQGLSTLTW